MIKKESKDFVEWVKTLLEAYSATWWPESLDLSVPFEEESCEL